MSQFSPYLVIGRKDTGVHTRHSIEDLQKCHRKQFTLFILSYLAIQGRSSGLEFTGTPLPAVDFAELAGIHGLPFKAWAGDPRTAAESKSDFDEQDIKDTKPVPSRFGGYCYHGSVVFPTWHRVYVMAIEQAVGSIASSIADQISKLNNIKHSEACEWTEAADKLRFPFWDWADERVCKEGLPPVLYTSKIEISMPGGKCKDVDNPLAWYDFKSIPVGFQNETDSSTGLTAYYADWVRTLRYAASDPDATKSNIDSLNTVLKAKAEGIRNQVALLFTIDDKADTAQAWDEFSNHTTESLRNMDYYNIGSLEGIHDSMHQILGGNGHMSDPDYAAFDPIFFLHHSNVDRLFAYWEYVYPNYFLKEGYTFKGQTYPFTQSRGTYWHVYNSELDHSVELAPFRTGKSVYWTPDQTRLLREEAYPKYFTYPKIAGIDLTQPPGDLVKARENLQKYYGLTPKATSGGLVATRPRLFNPPAEVVPGGLTVVSGYRHIVAVVQTPEFAFNGPYAIELHYSPDGKSSQLVGSVGIFARPDHSACKGCIMRRDAGSVVRGVIPIPATILDEVVKNANLNSASATDEEIVAALKSRLRGTITDRLGAQVGGAKGGPGGLSKEEDALPKNIVPDVTLVTAAAANRGGRGEGPVEWFDWKNHGEIFQGGHLAWGSPVSS